MAGYQAMAAELRAAGLRAEVFLGGGSMARQLKYADQRGAAVAVIEGGDERARGVVQLKDLALGARLAAEIATHEDWRRSRRRSRCRGRGWSRRCGRCWRGPADGCRPGLPGGRADGAGLGAARRRGGAHPGRARLHRRDAGGAGGAAAGGGAARPLRRGHPGAGLRDPRRRGGDDAAARLHRADRAAAHGRAAPSRRAMSIAGRCGGGRRRARSGRGSTCRRGSRSSRAATRRRTMPRCWR